ncbi:unnamed protein product [Pylaiella littoralis]
MAEPTVAPSLFTVAPTNATGNSTDAATPTPTPAPMELPEGAAANVQTNDWEDVQVAALTTLAAGAVLITLFECLRGRRTRASRSLYRQRHSLRYRKKNCRLNKIAVKPYPRGFLRWIPSTWRVSDSEFYQQVGMDGYVTLRFITLCKRLCVFAAFFGMVFLIPIYEQGIHDLDGASRLSIANLQEGGETLWAAVVFAYLFTIYFLYSLRKEFLAFMDLRNDWLAGGDVARSTQTAYTVRVERIPRAFRSPAILQKFFSTLFPGQVHSATVCLGLTDLTALTVRRAKCLQSLESAFIRQAALGTPPMVNSSWFGPKVNAIQHYVTQLAQINEKLRPKQEAKLEAAKNIERFRRKELRNMGASLENLALYFVDQLDRGGAEDEDGNARVSWLERRGGDREFTSPLQPLLQPMETVMEIQEDCDITGDDQGAADAAGSRSEVRSGEVSATSAAGSQDTGQQQQRQRQHLQAAQRRQSRSGEGNGVGSGSSSGSGGGYAGGEGRVDFLDEEKGEGRAGGGGGGGGGDGGVRSSRLLSPVAEEQGKDNHHSTHQAGDEFRGTRQGSKGSIGRAFERLNSLRSTDRVRAHSNHKDDEELSHGASWRHIVHMDHQDQAKEQALRLHEAEEILIEQGEDFIRYKLDQARRMSSLHQSLGAGALGRSIAAPRVSVHGPHPEGYGDGEDADAQRRLHGGGGSFGSNSSWRGGAMGHGSSVGSSNDNNNNNNNNNNSSSSSFRVNNSSSSRHGGGGGGGDEEGAEHDDDVALGRRFRSSSAVHGDASGEGFPAGGLRTVDLDVEFGGSSHGAEGGGGVEAPATAAPAPAADGVLPPALPPPRVKSPRNRNNMNNGMHGGRVASGRLLVDNSTSVVSPCESIASSFFSVSSPKKVATAGNSRRWSSVEASGGGGDRGGGVGRSRLGFGSTHHGDGYASRATIGGGVGGGRGGGGGGGEGTGFEGDHSGGETHTEQGQLGRSKSRSTVREESGNNGDDRGGHDGDVGDGGDAPGGAVVARDIPYRRCLPDPLQEQQAIAANVDSWPSSEGEALKSDAPATVAAAAATAAGRAWLLSGSSSTRTAETSKAAPAKTARATTAAAGSTVGQSSPLLMVPILLDDEVDSSADDDDDDDDDDHRRALPAAVVPGGGPPSELLMPRSELPRYVDDHDDDGDGDDEGTAGSGGRSGRRGQAGGAGAASRTTTAPPAGAKGNSNRRSKVKIKSGAASNSHGGPPRAVDAGGGGGGGGEAGEGFDDSPLTGAHFSDALSSSSRSSAVLLRRGGRGDGGAAMAEGEEGIGGGGGVGQEDVSPTRWGSEGVRHRRSGGRRMHKGALKLFPALFSRQRTPQTVAGDSPSPPRRASSLLSSSFASASPRDRRRISPRSRSTTAGGGGNKGGVGMNGGSLDFSGRWNSKGSSLQQRAAAFASAGRRSSAVSDASSRSDKPLMPWDAGSRADAALEAGPWTNGDGGGGDRSGFGYGGGEGRTGSTDDRDRFGSSSVGRAMRVGFLNVNSGVTKRARRTGTKVKRGVKGVKDTIKQTVEQSVVEVADAVKVLTKAGGMSGTGFVTFKCLSGRAYAVSTLVTNRPEVFNITPAPEPRDIVWKNVTNHVIHVQNRKRVVNCSLAVGIIFWSAVVSSIQTLSKVDTIAKVFPFVKEAADKDEFLTSLLEAYLPVSILLVIINWLYFALKWMALHLEGYKTYSEVERAVMSRYFFFHLANVFVTIGAGSIKDAIEKILEQPRELLNVLGETVPLVAVYFINLIIVKVVAGLMLELCFGGRPLKFWRILYAETFTDPRLRTKAGRTRGHYEPSEPWYGRFFADFLLVILIVFTFQVIAPVVAVAGLFYFVFAEIIYKYQLLHCYWPLYESGGLFFHKLFRQLVVGAVAGQVTLIGYMSIRQGLKQLPFLVPLPLVVLYLSSRWREAGRQTSNILSLDKAVLQDVQNEINVRDGAEPVWEAFTPTAYVQPSLLPGDPDAEFASYEAGDDSDVDVDEPLEMDCKGNVVNGNYGKDERRRRAARLVDSGSLRGSGARRRSSALLSNAFSWLSFKEGDQAAAPAAPDSGRDQEPGTRGPTRTVSSAYTNDSSSINGGNSRPDYSMA